MTQSRGVFSWKTRDELYVDPSDVLCSVSAPAQPGKSWEISEEDRIEVVSSFEKFLCH